MDSFQRASREKDQQRQVEVALEETREKYKQLQDENKKLMMVSSLRRLSQLWIFQ